MLIHCKTVFTALAALTCIGAYAGPAVAAPGKTGWQTPTTIDIPTGTTDNFAHAYCPNGYSVVNGAFFAANNTTLQNGFIVSGAGPRLDLSPPQYNEWVWNFEWPAGGSAAGAQVIVNVDCKKGQP